MVEDLLSRIPGAAPAGRKRVIQNTLAAVLHVRGTVDAAAKDPTNTPYGSATKVLAPYLKKTGAAELNKARRLVDHSKKELERERAALAKKAIGAAKPTDAEWRDRLFKMSPTERVAFFLKNPGARAAALREPELAGFDPTDYPGVEPAQVKAWLNEGLQRTIKETNEKGAARLQVLDQAHELLELSTRELTKALVEVPAIGAANKSGANKFSNQQHLEAWLNANAPSEVGELTAFEQAVFGAVDEAA
jgi:hypothetical protein